jgi:hypothetical protein
VCSTGAQVQEQVEHLLGRSTATLDWRADARIARKGERWVLQLNLQQRGRSATRTLQADDCVTLSDAAAWLIAVAIDPSVSGPGAVNMAGLTTTEAVTPETNAARADGGEKPAVPQLANSDKQARTDPATSAEEADQQPMPSDEANVMPVFAGGVFAGVSGAGLAGAAFSLGAQAELRLGWLWFGLLVGHDFERTRSLTSQLAAHFSSQEFGAQLCLQWGAALHFGPCLALTGRRTNAHTSASQGRDNAAFWATLGPCVQLTYALFSPLELSLNAGLFVPLSSRPEFELVQFGRAEPVGRAAGVGGGMRLGVGMHWQ